MLTGVACRNSWALDRVFRNSEGYDWALYTNTVMDVGDQCGVRGGACLFLVQYWPEFTLSRFEPNGTWSFLLARFNLKIWGSCSKSMLCKVPNFLEKSTFEHKTNQLTSFPAMDLGTRKLPGSGEAPRFSGGFSGSLGSPRIIFDSNCELQGSVRVIFKKTEPQETLKSLFSCLRSSVKDT